MIAGGSVDAFWEATPRTVAAVLAARRDRDWQTLATQAWFTAALTRCNHEDFPELGELIDASASRAGMSDAEIGHNIALWGAVIEHQFGEENTP